MQSISAGIEWHLEAIIFILVSIVPYFNRFKYEIVADSFSFEKKSLLKRFKTGLKLGGAYAVQNFCCRASCSISSISKGVKNILMCIL